MAAETVAFDLKDDAGTTLNTFHLPLSKLDATAAPGVNDDDAAGYVGGSVWVDRTGGKVYLCTDNATGAATWVEAGASGSGTDANDDLINLVWGTPGAESSDAIEIQASAEKHDATAFASAIVDVTITVTDAANDSEPSSTATISAAGTPVGTLLAGSGTATVDMRTDSSGLFAIKITETAAANRYLWIRAGGMTRVYVRSTVGVLELTFA